MARTSGYVIVLSEAERAELEHRVACYTLPHKVVVRAKIVLYAAEAQSNVEIARRLETAARVVGRWRKRFFERRLAGLEDRERAGRPRRFPPEQVAEVKALACELPTTHGLPLGRFSRTELHRLVVERGLSEASASTIWRWLHDDALKPWEQRSWIFVRDPPFAERQAGCSISTSAASSPPAAPRRVRDLRRREVAAVGARPPPRNAAARPRPRGPLRVRLPAQWHVRLPRRLGRPPRQPLRPRRTKDRHRPFGRLVDDVMTTEPYASARTVFWIVDNGSSHAGQASIDRLEGACDNLRLIHLPIHASWLNQIELYFSIVQRKALSPNDFDSLDALAERLLRFGDHHRHIAQPFQWTFTRTDIEHLLTKIDAHEPGLQLAA